MIGGQSSLVGRRVGVKQEFDTSTSVSNITGPAKVTRSGRLFSPDIAPPTIQRPLVITPASVPASLPDQVPASAPAAESSDARGRGIATDVPDRAEALKTTNVEASKQEMEEILKIIKKSDFNVVEQLGHTPSKISMLSLLLCSEAHAKCCTPKFSLPFLNDFSSQNL